MMFLIILGVMYLIKSLDNAFDWDLFDNINILITSILSALIIAGIIVYFGSN